MQITGVKKPMLIVILALCIGMFAGCGGTSNISSVPTSVPTQLSGTEQPVPAVSGTQASGSDIPDTQAFVKYTSSTGNYQLDVPEGWAQTASGTDVSFTSNLNTLQVTLTSAATQPTASSIRTAQAVTLQQTGRAVRDVKIQDIHLSSGAAVLMSYTSNSDPNPVTNKQVRLENNRYFFFHNGKLASLTLSAPVGADNVDQWARIAGSFQWR